uniref:Uncharacterized protein n=1 Tax=Romanomermis culicivorax TaxID=13658 RepID=A0A915JT13_ROMCU
MWYRVDSNPQTHLAKWMNGIPKHEPSFASDPGTYVCNWFTPGPIILDEEFHMETSVEQIFIDESDYTANPHSRFHFYSTLLNIIDFQNRFLFSVPLYAYPLRTMASVHTLTAEELLDHPTLSVDVEPVDEELLDTPIFDLNIAKLRPSTDASALPAPTATANLTAMATQITDFLKLMLDKISTLALVPMNESTLIQPIAMDAETNTATAQRLTDIPEEDTINQSRSMDIVPSEPTTTLPLTAPALDPRIYLATLATLPGPPIIATVTAARYTAPVPQVPQPAQAITQAAVQPPTALPPPVSQPPPPTPLLPRTGPMDVQTPQALSTSALALDRYGQPIRKPGRCEHSVKGKQHLQEEAEY